jgi:hypothetical protein
VAAFLIPPLKQTTYTASTIVLFSDVIGEAPLSYQWQFNGTNIDGATNAWLALTNLPFSAAGGYWCMASNSFGAATNLIGILSVIRSTPSFNSAAMTFTSSGFSLELDHLSSHGPVIIYTTTDLINWLPIFTNPPVLGSFQFLDSGAASMPYLFYRAVEQ